MKRATRWMVTVGLLLWAMGVAQAAFSGWQYKSKITFQGYTRGETLTNFTLLVKLGTNVISNFSYDQFLSAGGADLRFVDSNDTDVAELEYELEEWNTNGESIVWVRIPKLDGPAHFIYAYWGKSGESFPAYTTNGLVWGDSYRAVWHLKEDQSGMGTANLYKDSTTNHYDGDDQVGSSGKDGIADGGQQFNGTSDTIPLSLRLTPPAGLTFSAWVRTTNPDAASGYVGNAALNVLGDTSGGVGIGFGVHDRVARYNYYYGGWNTFTGRTSVADGNWHQIAVTHKSADGSIAIFADGRRDNTGAITYQGWALNMIGEGYPGTPHDYFDGNLDEVRVADGVLSTNWIWATWINVASNETFNDYGAAASTGGKPVIDNDVPIVNTHTSATLRGYHSDTGTTETTVSVYWGTAEGLAPTSGLWQATNTFAAGQWDAGSYPSTNVTLPVSNVFYYYRFYAENAGGSHWPNSSASFLGGDVWVTAPDADAGEVGPNTGTFTIQRGATATNLATLVPYTFGGEAVRNNDYTLNPAPLTVTLPPGVAGANITLTPLPDGDPLEGPETATLVLGSGLYAIGTPASNTITIADGPAISVTNMTTAVGNWDSALIWSLGRAPLAADHVVVQHAVILRSSSPLLKTFAITNATLTFTNWTTTLNASNATIRGGGVLTHALCDTGAAIGNTNRVHVVCSNLTIEAGGAIDVDWKGYAPGQGPGVALAAGGYSGGAGYGGAGARSYYVTRWGGPAYGSVSAPVDPGSGAGNLGLSGSDVISGNGGGAVRLDVNGTLTLDGAIRANGQQGLFNYYGGGGGSGGGIYITCGTFQGSSGSLSANGGNSSYYFDTYGFYSGSAGGGRIAVHYTSVGSPHSLRFSTAGGTGICDTVEGHFKTDGDSREQYRPEPGTLWLPDTALLSPLLADRQFFNVRLYGPSSWSVDSLSVSNCSLWLAQDGFVLRVTNDLSVGAGGQLGVGWLNGGAKPVLYGEQNVIVTNGGVLCVYAGMTNGTPEDYGALVSVTGDIRVAASSWIRPYCQETNGGTVLFRAENLSVAANGGINATARGYVRGHGPGKGGVAGSYNGGPGHGGRGGRSYYVTALRGGTYGSLSKPLAPGSSSDGTVGSSLYMNGKGGGVVRVEARTAVTILGTLSADGGNGDHPEASSPQGAGGSGGSVYVKCGAFSGAGGLLSAKGGNSSTHWNPYPIEDFYSGGGGGGRIALDYVTAGSSPRFATSPGKGIANWAGTEWDTWRPYAAQNGTVYLPDDSFLTTTLAGDLFQDVCLTLGVSAWTVPSLTVSNCSVAFVDNGFHLTVNGNVFIGANGSLGIGASLGEATGTGYVFTCSGNVTVTDGGALHVYGGRTNGTDGDYGTLVDVAGDLSIGANCWLYPYSHEIDGGSPLLRVGSLLIPATNSGVNANGRGYAVTNGPGRGLGGWEACVGYGPGGGYGGRGGNDYYYYTGSDFRGETYGSSNAPAAPGSGSGSWNGGYGGGLVRVEAGGTILVNGTISANGGEWADLGNNLGGGGSGGGIYLQCNHITGGSDALIGADGGDGGPAYDYNGPGGGGRIAAYFRKDTFLGAKSRTKGENDYVPSGQLAEDGTLVWFQLPPSETLILVR